MKLSPIAQAVNRLCLMLTPPAPVNLMKSDWQAFDPWAVPDFVAHQKAVDEMRKAAEDFCRIRGPVHYGWDLASGPDTTVYWHRDIDGALQMIEEADRRHAGRLLDGWWAKIGGNPPTFWPPSITPKDLQGAAEGFFRVQPMHEHAVRTWFDEQAQEFRHEPIERTNLYRADGSAPTLPDLSDAKYAITTASATTASTYRGPPITLEGIERAMEQLEHIRALERANPDAPIQVTKAELDHLADLLHVDRPVTEPMPSTLMGIPIQIVPDDSFVLKLFPLQDRIARQHPLLQRRGLSIPDLP